MAKEYTQNLDKILKIDGAENQDHLGEMVRGTVDDEPWTGNRFPKIP